jgi:hypothetical protein
MVSVAGAAFTAALRVSVALMVDTPSSSSISSSEERIGGRMVKVDDDWDFDVSDARDEVRSDRVAMLAETARNLVSAV